MNEMSVKFVPLDYDYVDRKDGSERSIVRVFGRTEGGKRICVIDSTEAYFYILPKADVDLEKFSQKIKKISLSHANRTARVNDVKIVKKKFMGKDVEALQVFINNPKDLNTIKDVVKEYKETAEKKEIDINFITRYIIDRNVRPLQWHSVEGEKINGTEYGDLDVDIILEAKNISPTEGKEFRPNVLAFDIETTEFDIGKGEIIMLSMVNENMKKVLTWKKFKNPPTEVEFVKNEEELLEKFVELIKLEKPDILTGYFSDGFDLPYLRARADMHGIKLGIGLDGSNISFIRGGLPSCEIRGLVHVDLFKFVDNIISANLQSETISLNDVAKELIGEEKVEIDLNKITREMKDGKSSKDEEMKRFSLYNLQDSVLTLKLFEKLWPNIAEMTKVVSEPLFDVSRASYSQLVEDYIIHDLKKFNEIAENRPIRDEIEERRTRPKYIGAFVKEPKAGLYEDVSVFDFRSFWPNIIVSFNISAATFHEKKEKGDYETPEFEYEGKEQKFYFAKDRGFIPQILSELLERRKEVKQKLKKNRNPIHEAEDYALKTLANATYGYFGFFGARWYCPEGAASATAIGRYYIHKTIDEIEKAGFEVTYSDTDSIMFTLGKKSQENALEILEKINDSLPGTMELELEKFYKRGIFVMKKTGEAGAKKKYALLSKDGTLKIRGFESVRRDKCVLAKEIQEFVIKKVLDEGKAENALKHVKDLIKKVKDGKAISSELIIRTQLTKPIEEYSSIGPHVAVAKRMREKGIPIKEGGLVEYIVGAGTQKLIRERARIPNEVEEGEYDSDYYINNQIVPAIEGIFNVFDISVEELKQIKKKKQKSLGEF